ncbi:hypothetical protein EDC01DRAFT_441237 [Geopyxis carbonaria]|nr:hypothetical protein EDC01DRAFT_441237 [Geopyxis carbonaria]
MSVCPFAYVPPEIILQIFKVLDSFDSVAAFRLSHLPCSCAVRSTHDSSITVIMKSIASASLPAWPQLKTLHLVHVRPISDFKTSTLSETVIDFTPNNVLPAIKRIHKFASACVFRFVQYHQSLNYISSSHEPSAAEIERIYLGVYICSLIYDIGRKRRERADRLPGIKSSRRYLESPAFFAPAGEAIPAPAAGAAPDELGILHDWGYSREDCVLTAHLEHLTTRKLLYALHVATFFRRAYETLYGVPDRFLFDNIPSEFLQAAPFDIIPVSSPDEALDMPFEDSSPHYQWPSDWSTHHLDIVSSAVLKRQRVDPEGQDRDERHILA